MKKLAFLLLLFVPMALLAQDFVNLTLRPYSISVKSGISLPLPDAFTLSTASLPDSLAAEAERFADAFGQETGRTVTLASEADDALVRLVRVDGCEPEEYRLTIDATSVTLSATTSAGFFYGFQTIRKILKDDGTLPALTLRDKPRFTYRGFMLDCARHFFPVGEVKKIIDLMARYKLNRFHWHLTDDQGWRVEIKKYPKLTTIGATADNCYVTDMKYGPYWTNRQYGPYFYTQEEVREVVAYARERHIEVIPEVEMPGHHVAALCAYPEYSCTPSATRSVWTSGGISSDVLNVGNPQAVQFCKDVLSELFDLFPSQQFHIGGDECPTSAWEGNAQCQALYKSLGLSSYRALQSHFIKDLADFAAEKGKRLSVWNEAITASGADTELMQQAGVTVYCWTGAEAAAKKSAELGLNNIFTPWGPYYINRKQSTRADEPSAAGDGTDNLAKTYNTVPVPTGTSAALQKYYTGVQGTFWTEHVADTAYLEYLALPRLLAIAEAGWTQQSAKNYTDFVRRATADTLLLDRLGFGYCRHDLNVSETATAKVMPKAGKYYRIVTRATDDNRKGRCIELLRAASPLIATYSANGAAANVLWTNVQAAEGADNYDHQQWTFEEDPAREGYYALVCKAQPAGSVNPTPTAQNNTGRWRYDATTKNYNFILGEAAYGQSDADYYYSIRSERTSGWYVNASMPGQGLAVNLWTDALSGNGGVWTFAAVDAEEVETPEPIGVFEEGKYYRIENAVEGFGDICLADLEEDVYLRYAPAANERTVWQAFSVEQDESGGQRVRLQNLVSGRNIYANASKGSGQVGWPVRLSKSRAQILVTRNAATDDYSLLHSSRNFFPVMADGVVLPGIVSSGSTLGDGLAVRPQGAAWRIVEVNIDGLATAPLAASVTPTATYDLLGRRLPTADSASIVIKDGKKWRVRR